MGHQPKQPILYPAEFRAGATGVLVVPTPTAHNPIECQDFRIHLFLLLTGIGAVIEFQQQLGLGLGRNQNFRLQSLGASTALKAESEKLKPFIEVRDFRLFFREYQLQCGGQKRGEFLLHCFRFCSGSSAQYDESAYRA
jgi:hypothetical protein